MMGKSQAITLLVGTLCLLSLARVSHADADEFTVEGMVYCDTCRLQFMTRASYNMEGATVKLQCRNITTGVENYNAEATSDKAGQYSFKVSGDYEDDICQVTLLKSSKEDCSEVPTEQYAQQAAQISLTSNNGEATPIRNANPLGFMKKEPLPVCEEIIKELEINDENFEEEGHDSGLKSGSASATEAPTSPDSASGSGSGSGSGAGTNSASSSGSDSGADSGSSSGAESGSN